MSVLLLVAVLEQLVGFKFFSVTILQLFVLIVLEFFDISSLEFFEIVFVCLIAVLFGSFLIVVDVLRLDEYKGLSFLALSEF